MKNGKGRCLRLRHSLRVCLGACFSACLSICLCGCNSIILNGDLEIKAYKPVTAPPVWDGLEYEPDTAAALEEMDGVPAFYILNDHESDPGRMEDFKFLDLIDGEITVYAYKTPYYGKDGSGLSGQEMTGTADSQVLPANSATEADGGRKANGTVTVLMAYHTATKKYLVFFCKVSGGSFGEEAENTAEFKALLNAQNETGICANKAEEEYFLYHEGIGYLFARDGTELSRQNLTEVLNGNISRYLGMSGGGDVTISDVIMDAGQMIYVPMVIEKNGTSDFENMEEADLSDTDNAVKKVLCCCYYLDAGKDSEPPVWFEAVNVNAKKQEELWCGIEEDGSGRLSMGQVKEAAPDTYAAYTLNQDLDLQLCGYREQTYHWFWLYNSSKWIVPSLISPNNVRDFLSWNAGVMGVNAENGRYYYIKNAGDGGAAYMDYYNSLPYFYYRLLGYGRSGDWFHSTEPVTKTITRTYTTTETETDEEGNETEVSTEHEEQAEIITGYRLYLREGTKLYSSSDWWTSNMTAAGRQGLIQFGTESGGDTSFLFYRNTNDDVRDGYEFQLSKYGIPGQALSAGVTDLGESECVILFTGKGIFLMEVPYKTGKRRLREPQYFIRYEELDYRQNGEGNSDSYGMRNLRLDGGVLTLSTLYNGIVRYDLDSGTAVQLDGGSCFASYATDSGTLAVLGFREDGENGTIFSAKDLPLARLYRIDLNSADTALRIAGSRLDREPELYEEICQGRGWDKLIKALGLEAHRSEVNAYFEFLAQKRKNQEAGLDEFFRLAGIRESDAPGIRQEALACYYGSSLEELMVRYRSAGGQTYYEVLTELKRSSGLSDEEWTKRLQYLAAKIQGEGTS